MVSGGCLILVGLDYLIQMQSGYCLPVRIMISRPGTTESHQVPRLPRKAAAASTAASPATSADQACHKCHAKWLWMSPSATPATQKTAALCGQIVCE